VSHRKLITLAIPGRLKSYRNDRRNRNFESTTRIDLLLHRYKGRGPVSFLQGSPTVGIRDSPKHRC